MAHTATAKFNNTSHLLCLMILVAVTFTSLLVHPSSQNVDPSKKPIPSAMWSAGGSNNDTVSGPYFDVGESFYYEVITGGPTDNVATSGGETFSITNQQYYIVILVKSVADDTTALSKTISSSSLLQFKGASIQGTNLVVIGTNSGQMTIDSTTISNAGSFQFIFHYASGSLTFKKIIATPTAAENTFVWNGVGARTDAVFSVGSVNCSSVSNGAKVNLQDTSANGQSLSLTQTTGTLAIVSSTKWDASTIRLLPKITGNTGISETTAVKIGTNFIYACGYYSNAITFTNDKAFDISLLPSSGAADPFIVVLDTDPVNKIAIIIKNAFTGTSSQKFDEPKAILPVKSQSGENVYVVGYHSLTSDRVLDGEVGKAKAAFISLYIIDSTSGQESDMPIEKIFSGDIIFNSISSYGNYILVTGYFSGTVTIGSTILKSAGGSDMLLVCFDSTTLQPKWALREGGISNEFGYNIFLKDPYIWVSGTMSRDTTLQFLQVSFPTQSQNADGFQIGFGSPFFCNGIACNDDSVCNSHGVCTGNGTCTPCDSGYTGANCDTFYCFGKASNATNVCSSHGTCLAPDTCSCISGYGNECQLPTCNGIKSNDTQNVCSGRGTCVDYDTCSCPASYGGPTCSIVKCFGILATNSSVCNGYPCSSANICDCPQNRRKDDCSEVVEYTKYTTSTVIASGNPIKAVSSLTGKYSAYAYGGGYLYYFDTSDNKLYKATMDGEVIGSIAGSGKPMSDPNILNSDPKKADLTVTNLQVAPNGDLYFLNTIEGGMSQYILCKIGAVSGLAEFVFASAGSPCANGATPSSCKFTTVTITIDGDFLYVASTSCVKKITLSTGIINDLFGDYNNPGGFGLGNFPNAYITGINSMVVSNGYFYLSLPDQQCVVKADTKSVAQYAGTCGDRGPNSPLTHPLSIAMDPSGSKLYINDRAGVDKIKVVNGGAITEYAGASGNGQTVDGTILSQYAFDNLYSLSFYGNELYFITSSKVKKITNSKIYSVIGASGNFVPNGKAMRFVTVSSPQLISVSNGSVYYVDDLMATKISKFDIPTKTLTTLIQNGISTMTSNSKGEFYIGQTNGILLKYNTNGVQISTIGNGPFRRCGQIYYLNRKIFCHDTNKKRLRYLNLDTNTAGVITTTDDVEAFYFSSSKLYTSILGNVYDYTANTYSENPSLFGYDYHQVGKGADVFYDEKGQTLYQFTQTGLVNVIRAGQGSELKTYVGYKMMKGNMVNSNPEVYFYGGLKTQIVKTDFSTDITYSGKHITNDFLQMLPINSSFIIVTKTLDPFIYKLNLDDKTIELLVSGQAGYIDGPFDVAGFVRPSYLAKMSDSEIIVSDMGNLRLINFTSRMVSTINYGGFQDDVISNIAILSKSSNDEIFIGDSSLKGVKVLDSNDQLTIPIASTATTNPNSVSGRLDYPSGVCKDELGNVFVSDKTLHVIRKYSTRGVMTVIAGKEGTSGYKGDYSDASNSLLDSPTEIRCSKGQLFFLDGKSTLIRKISSNNTIYTVYSGTVASFDIYDNDIYNLIIADSTNSKIQLLSGICEPGWIGKCDIWTCNGTAYTNQSVCSGVGECLGVDQCKCQEGYRGKFCSMIPNCYGFNYTQLRNGCSFNGECIDRNLCSCDSGWIGSQCEIPTCSGILYNDASVCGGRGACKTANNCTCNEGWTGTNCTIPICYGFSGKSACNGNGLCLENHTCICDKGWKGTNCSIPFCFGIPNDNSSRCSSHGQCISVDVCKCTSGYEGKECQDYNCFGKSKNSTSVCSNQQGTCMDVNTCSCFNAERGITFGAECEQVKCLGASNQLFDSNDTKVCSGHGSCVFHNSTNIECNCSTGYMGSYCQYPICFDIPSYETNQVCNGRGVCSLHDKCDCIDGWTGANCSIPICFGFTGGNGSCNDNGDCVWKDTCTCYEGWKGANCSIPFCFGIPNDNSSRCSSHGQCIAIDECECNYGYEGENCELHMCYGKSKNSSLVCSNQQGVCIDANACSCFNVERGITFGAECNEIKCFGENKQLFDSNDAKVCSGHGSCEFHNSSNIECNCTTGYMGSYCQYPICFDIPSYETNQVCNGRGVCSLHDTCICKSGWTGANCSIPTCFGYAGRDGCSQNGDCTWSETCSCDSGWYGANCSIPSCFGVPANLLTTCSSHGTCSAMNECKCIYGYEGDNCELHMCYGKSKNSTSVCSNQRGICISANECKCFQTETGRAAGQECNQVECMGANSEWIDSNNVRVCSGVGNCVYNSSSEIYCNCSVGFTGPYCQYPICDGIPSYSKQVCSGNGQCIAPNTCSCNNDDTNGHYKGKLCEKCKAPYSGAVCNYIEPCGNVSKCHSHGFCDEYGFCTCFQDDSNGYWNGSTCNYCNNGFYGEDCLTQIQSDVKFSNYGDSLVFKLSYPPHFTSNIVNCSKLFDSNKKLFGSNPICKYLNKNSNDFVIELDQDHAINIGDQIELNRNVFNRYSNALDMTMVQVFNATNPSLPVIITSNKEVFAKCENVVLDASTSYSLDRKYNSYKWEIISSNLNSLSNSDNSKVIINYDSLNAGNHTFQVTVTSYIFKVSNIKQVTIQKMDYITPAISIDGSSSIQVKTTDIPIIIRKSIELTNCLPSNSKQIISWEYLSGSGIEYQVDSFNDLKIVKFNDLTQTNHQFKVSAYVTGYEQQVSTAIVNIQLVIRPLSVNLIIVEHDPDYVSFEIEEIDPDNENTTLSRVWSFANLAQSSLISNYLMDNSNTSTFTITKQLAQQTSQFDISVQINKRSRSATATLSISFPDSIAKIAPIITLANSLPSNLNKGTLFNMQLLLTGEGNHTSRSWSLNSQSIPNSMVSMMRTSLQNSNSLLLSTDALTEGSQNRISFTVTNLDSSLSASIDSDFIINKPPKACTCLVTPSTGIALTTSFSFNCPSCQNDANTYSFEYGFIDDYSGASITLSKDEPLYQKLPPAYYGNVLQLYVKVTDTITGASTLTYNKVTINLPSVKSVSEIRALSKSWSQTASLLQAGDYKRGVFNTATISRTTNLLLKAVGAGRRSQLVNQDQMVDIQNLLSELLSDFENSNQVKAQVGELLNSVTLFNMLFGFDSILQNSQSFNSTLGETSLNILKEIVNSAQQSAQLSLSNFDQFYLKSILDTLYSYIVKNSMSEIALVEMSRNLGSVMLRSILIGQSPIKFETQFHLNYLNKHFKNELNSMRLTSDIVNITLPSRISTLLTTSSIKTPISYDWFIEKDGKSYSLPQVDGKEVKLVSNVNSLTMNPVPKALTSNDYIYNIQLKQYDSQLTYTCAKMSSSQPAKDSDCSISIENQIATCKCPQLYNLGVLQYKSLPVTPQQPSNSNDLLYLLFLLLLIPIIIVVIIIVYFVMRRSRSKGAGNSSFAAAPHSYMRPQESETSIEMKSSV